MIELAAQLVTPLGAVLRRVTIDRGRGGRELLDLGSELAAGLVGIGSNHDLGAALVR